MSALVSPFVANRPICAAIYVDEDTVKTPEPTSRLFSRLARNSAGDLYTLHYLFDLPVSVTLVDVRNALFIVYNTDSAEPVRSRVPAAPHSPPEGFPSDPPSDPPELLLGIPCHYRRRTSGNETVEIWYSYEYGAVLKTISTLPGYGTTIWRLDEVKLEEPPAELFSEAAILACGPERIRNIWKAAGEFFARIAEEGPEFRRDL